MHKKVSVIIPAFNAAAYIRKSVESVLAQTYQNFEVIVIDDGSTDGTAEIVKSFVDKRIKYFYQENKGISGARNAGFGLSSGEYVIFLDSDDLLEPACLEKSVAFLGKKQEFGAVYFNYFIFYWSDPKKRFSYLTPVPEGNLFFSFLRGTWMNMSRVLFKMHTINDFRFDEKLKGSEDWDFLLQVSSNGSNFGYLNEVLVGIGIRKTGSSHSSGRRGRLIASSSALQLLDKWRPVLKAAGEENLFPTETYFKYKLRNSVDEWAMCNRRGSGEILKSATPKSFREFVLWHIVLVLIHFPCRLAFAIDWYYMIKQTLIFKRIAS